MPLLKRRCVFAAKVETTIGTAESLTGAEGVYNAFDVKIQPNITIDEREGQGGFNYLVGVPGIRSGTATFSTELSCGNSLPTWASVLLPACGWIDSSNTFSPISRGPASGSTLPKTVTIGAYIDGMLRILSGCMGTFVIELPTGRPGKINWTFQGKWTNPTDATIIAPTYPTDLPLRFATGSIAWASASMCVESVTVDAGNEVILRECAGDATGIVSALVTNRKPMIKASPEMVLVATQDRHSQFLTPTDGSLVITTGAASEDHIVITASDAQIVNIQSGDRNGMMTDEIEWMATKGSAADTELTIAFVQGV